jgi:hypothetical protein
MPDVDPKLAAARAGLTIGFVGNCQAEVLRNAFHRAASGQGVRSFYHFFDVPEVSRERARADIAACDILLMQDIQDVESYPLHDSVRAGTRIVPFPFLRFASPWPYDDFNGPRDAAARARDDPALHTTIYYDGVLGRLRRLTPEPEARFEVYASGRAAGMIDPARVHDFETRRLEALDGRFGFGIGRAILDGFRDAQLFYTVNRPNGALLARVLDDIVKRLGFDWPAAKGEDLDELRSIQTPVHPHVARGLGITWAGETRLYEARGRRFNWEGWVRDYIARYG